MASITVTVGKKTQVITLGTSDSAAAVLLEAASTASTKADAASASAASAASSAAAANLFMAGVTDLGSITDAPLQTFDMGTIT
jgi:hypothetical protein